MSERAVYEYELKISKQNEANAQAITFVKNGTQKSE